jgi:hypothetical protein
MNQEIKMNFQTENLVIDWISFNFKGLRDPKSIDEACAV